MKFVVVGVSNTAVFLGIYYTLLAFGVFYLIANVFAFIFSVLNSFFWSRNFVFGKKSSVPAKIQLAKAYAAYGFTAIISTITLFIMVELIGISEFIAPLLNLLITVPINFLVNKFWTYK
jgi:putative flippase GtrA